MLVLDMPAESMESLFLRIEACELETFNLLLELDDILSKNQVESEANTEFI